MVSLRNIARALEVRVTMFMEIPAGETPVRRKTILSVLDSPVEYYNSVPA